LKKVLAVLAAMALMVAVMSVPALAQQQSGLVNLNISGNTVQVPVAVAANICDVSVNVVAQNTERGGTTTCEALADAEANNGNGGN
jgi:hypothetical protein